MLEASDLCVSPPDAPDPVVRGVSLRLDRGEWLGLEGLNGSGKTTLLMAIAGLWPARSGTLRLGGRAWGPAAPERERGAVAVVMQEPSSQLLTGTVTQELEFSLLNLGWEESRRLAAGRRWSDALGLAALGERNPLTLSAGEQQRLLLAAALASEPSLLVCDEGGAHLDAEWRGRVLDRVHRETVERGMSVVWASQEREELARADHILRLGPPDPTWVDPSGSSADESSSGAGSACPSSRVLVRPTRSSNGPTVQVSEALSFEIADRGVIAICGPNGSGKSVLLAALAAVEASAQVAWEHPRLDPPPAYAGQFPDRQVFADSAGDEILYGPLRRGRSAGEVECELAPWLTRLGYEGPAFSRRRTWGLSAAERRIVTLAGALLSPASMVALDEPTVGLDRWRAGVLAAWVQEKARRIPVVVATQDEPWARSIGAKIIRLGGTY